MALLKSFCLCGSLRTGTLIAGFAGIILAILGIVVIFTVPVEIRTIVLDWLPKLAVQIIMAVNFAMTILISILLIIGTMKRNMYLMIPWVLLGIMLAIGLVVSVIYTAVDFYLKKDSLTGSVVLVLGLAFFVVYVYMWMVVYSFFAIIKEETDRGAYTKDPFRRAYN
ncbi:hypothetical protein PPYR_13095 [Photinus pyralis]|uniref:MARVEL domain-containing protein n=1 Tax=Photinus pyralis TaxID=7054 RepID=A0A5N4A842_PHOPY|nr:uncharacterized protein LOC116179193 [Photinus pyralis]XP_031354769.1 uncharacterized protein LOC116179193 [Photinus pyralis]KAB0793475.1 hypothetical protein PPYR_13095 [Photinus pyralis]